MNHFVIRLVSALFTFLLGLSVTAIISPHSSRVSSDPAAEQEVLRVERQYIQAHLNRDVATLDDILADEFYIGGSRCRSTNKAQRLALVGNAEVTFEAINTEDVQVSVNGVCSTARNTPARNTGSRGNTRSGTGAGRSSPSASGAGKRSLNSHQRTGDLNRACRFKSLSVLCAENHGACFDAEGEKVSSPARMPCLISTAASIEGALPACRSSHFEREPSGAYSLTMMTCPSCMSASMMGRTFGCPLA
jgi:hypothetical protein